MLGFDHSAYPHLIDQVLMHADAQGLNAFRSASRASLAKVEAIHARRARHVRPHTRSDGRVIFPSRGSLPALTINETAELAALPSLRRRYRAVQVLDVGWELELRGTGRALRDLLDGIHTVRLVGDMNAPLPFTPSTVVVAADLGRPEPFRGWLLSKSLVVNYTAGEGGALALAFFPPSGYYGPSSLTMIFTRCRQPDLERMPNGARLGARLLGDLARVVCDGHAVTLVDWGKVAALFPPGTRAEDVEQLRTWGGQDHKAARRKACVLRLARLALEPGANEEGPDCVTSLSAEDYRCEVGEQTYADYTEGLDDRGVHFIK